MKVYEAFETSDELVKEGRWIEVECLGEVVCSFKVRSASPDLNVELRKAMAAEAIQSMATLEGLSDAVADPDLENRLFAESVITDWKNVTDKDGKAIKCTKKNVVQLFNDLPLLANRVKREAYRWTNYRRAFEEKAVGNSSKS